MGSRGAAIVFEGAGHSSVCGEWPKVVRMADDELDEVAATVGVLIREEMEVQHRLGGHPVPVGDCASCAHRLPENRA